MVKFCTFCDNIIHMELNDKLVYKCNICDKTFPFNETVYSKTDYDKKQIKTKILNDLKYSKIIPFKYIKCKKCDNNKLHYVVTKKMINIYYCRTCDTLYKK